MYLEAACRRLHGGWQPRRRCRPAWAGGRVAGGRSSTPPDYSLLCVKPPSFLCRQAAEQLLCAQRPQCVSLPDYLQQVAGGGDAGGGGPCTHVWTTGTIAYRCKGCVWGGRERGASVQAGTLLSKAAT